MSQPTSTTLEMSRSKQVALAAIPKISGFVSFALSTIIAVTILSNSKKRSRVYHRLILGLSISDMCTSFAYSLSTWPIPAETDIHGAMGTTATCTVQAFFVQLSTTALLYSVSLSIYYLLAINYGWKETPLKRIEPLFHIIPVAFGLGTATAGVVMDLYNSANLWCWIADYEDRTTSSDIYRWTFFYGVMWAGGIFISICLAMVFRYVRKITLSSEQWAHNSERSEQFTSTLSLRVDLEQSPQETKEEVPQPEDTTTLETRQTGMESTRSFMRLDTILSNNTQRSENPFARRRREVAYQNLRYALAFYWTYIPITIVRIYQTIDKEPPFALFVMASLNTPLQGLPNFLVYLYPMLVKAGKSSNTPAPPPTNRQRPSCERPAPLTPVGSSYAMRNSSDKAASEGLKSIKEEEPLEETEAQPFDNVNGSTKVGCDDFEDFVLDDASDSSIVDL